MSEKQKKPLTLFDRIVWVIFFTTLIAFVVVTVQHWGDKETEDYKKVLNKGLEDTSLIGRKLLMGKAETVEVVPEDIALIEATLLEEGTRLYLTMENTRKTHYFATIAYRYTTNPSYQKQAIFARYILLGYLPLQSAKDGLYEGMYTDIVMFGAQQTEKKQQEMLTELVDSLPILLEETAKSHLQEQYRQRHYENAFDEQLSEQLWGEEQVS